MTTNKKTLVSKIEQSRKKLNKFTGKKRLIFLQKLLKTAKLYSEKTAEELIDENLTLIETIRTEESALLMGEKAFFCFQNASLSEAEKYADKALTLSRDIGSNQAEVKALIIKGYINDVRGQHKKVVAWYTMALERCTKLQRPGILLELGTSYSKQGEYDRAIVYLNEVIKHSDRLIHNKSIAKEERINQRRIYAEAWSRLGVIYESIGDFNGAQKAYDLSIELFQKYDLVWEQYKTLSRKVKLLIMRENFPEAERCLVEAQNLPLSGLDSRAPLFIAHDWTRLYRAKAQYSDAMDEYEEILYGALSDSKAIDKRLYNLMRHQADIFGEILSGIHECLRGLNKERLAEMVDSATRIYEGTLTGSGIYKEADKKGKLKIQERNIINILEPVFQKRPHQAQYKDIIAEYNPDKGTAKVTKGKKKFTLNKRAFLIFKYLVDHTDECVTREELEHFWKQHQIGCYSEESGVRTYIQRDIRKKLGLDQFIEQCPKPKGGWRLVP